MIYFLIEFFLVSSLLLLLTLFLWRRISQPALRVTLGRIVLLLLLISIPLVAWPKRPAISLLAKTTISSEVSPVPEINEAAVQVISHHEPLIPTNNPASFDFPVSGLPTSPSKIADASPVNETAATAPDFSTDSVNLHHVSAESRSTSLKMPEIAIGNVIVTFYFLGAFGVALWLLAGAVRLHGFLRRSKAAPVEIEELLRSITATPVKVKIVLHRTLAAPIVWGVFRPGIALPDFLYDSATENKQGLRFALAHEWAHLRSRDLWCLALCRFLTLILYPNPLFWRLMTRLREDQEILADAAAAALVPEQNDEWENRRQYALELVRWSRAAQNQPSHFLTASTVLAIFEWEKLKRTATSAAPSLERRINMLLQDDRVRLRTSWLWKSCCVLGVGTAVALMSIFTLQPKNVISAQEVSVVDMADQGPVAEKQDAALKTETKGPYDVPDTFQVTVIDEQGKPLPGVELFLNIWGGEIEKTYRQKIKSDENGLVAFDLTPIKGKKFDPCRLWASAPGYIPLFSNWDRTPAPCKPFPDELTITMEKAVEYSGRVVDEEGNPIEDVKMMVVGPSDPSEPNKSIAVWSLWLEEDLKTDADGRWKSNVIPPKGEIRFGFKHPDYLNVEYGEYKAQDDMTTEKLRDGSAVYVMKRGIAVEGTVTDQDGKPLSGATVRIGSNDMISYWGNKAATTDEQGKYRIYWKTGTCPIMASAKGRAPELKMLTVAEKNDPVDFVLKPGKTVKIRAVDSEGKPLSGVSINPLRWRGTERYFDDKIKGNDKTGEDGSWTWNEAPDDSVQYFFYRRGLRSEEQNYVLKPREEPYTVRMLPMTKATGRVLDAKTKEPIPAFTINPGYRWSEEYGEPTLQTHSSEGFRDGKFEFEVDRQNFGYNLRFTADGYVPYVSPTFKADESAELTVELAPAEPIGAVVLLPDGTPAENAEVTLFSAASGMQTVWDGKIRDGMRTDPSQRTKADGRFSFQPQLEGYVIVVFHEAGAAQVYAEDLKDGTAQLQPWSRVEGIVKKGEQPWPERHVRVAAWGDCETWDKDRPCIQFIYNATSDRDGKFSIDKMIPGRKISAFWEEDYGRSPLDHFAPSIRSDNVSFESEPGKTATITLGGAGRPVTGKIVVTTEAYKDKIDWEFVKLELKGIPNGIARPDYDSLPVPEGIDPNDSTSFGRWYWSWISKDEKGKEFRETVRKYDEARPAQRSCRIEKDGSFRVENVPPGKYEFSVEVFQPKPIEDIPPAEGAGLGGSIKGRLSLNNHRREPVVTIPAFNGTVTGTPANLGKIEIELWP